MRSKGCTGKVTYRITTRFVLRTFKLSSISAGTSCDSGEPAVNSAKILMARRSGLPRLSSGTSSNARMDDTFDVTVRTAVYRHFASTRRSPTLDAMREAIRATSEQVRDGYRRLYAKRMVVPAGDFASIRMAPADFRADRPDGRVLGSPSRQLLNAYRPNRRWFDLELRTPSTFSCQMSVRGAASVISGTFIVSSVRQSS